MKRYAALLPVVAAPALLAMLARPVDEAAPAPTPPTVVPGKQHKIQVALLIDNSGSMSGLIDQARSELWTIVGSLAETKKGGKAPIVEVALYAYGDPTQKPLVPFTTDLDAVSEAMFSLGISGGDEWCGATIGLAVDQLAWSNDPDDLRVLYIAGNEEFTQGPVRWQDAIAKAKQKDVLVNTIHCGGRDEGWQKAALLAGGAFTNIDHNAKVAQIATPYDAEIAALGAQLNDTYVPYGAKGGEGRARQLAQDGNALGVGASTGSKRALAKASAAYDNSGWDLVDALKNGKADAAQLDEATKQKVKEAQGKREEIQAKMKDLAKKRAAFETEAKKNAPKQATLDNALLESIQAPAAAKGFSTAQ